MRRRPPAGSPTLPPTPGEARRIDQLYGLEPVWEPESPSAELAPFQTVCCPYCGEHFDTRIDTSGGSASYIEDCQVCCQPIQFAIRVDSDDGLLQVTLGRGD